MDERAVDEALLVLDDLIEAGVAALVRAAKEAGEAPEDLEGHVRFVLTATSLERMLTLREALDLWASAA